MKNRIKYLLLLSLTIYFHSSMGQSMKKKIDSYVSSYEETGDFSGCVTISKKGSIIYNQCFGMANHAFDIDNNVKTKFKIGSISKQFTAVAILILEEQGLLSTTDTLSKFFSDYKNAESVTIHQLLTHTSGVNDIFNMSGFSNFSCQKISLKELTELLLKEPLLFEPGTQYLYSNGGYALLAHIIEEVSGENYNSYLTKNIFMPLGMKSTAHASGNQIVKDLAEGYDPLGYSQWVKADYIDNELLKGSGSLHSNSVDILLWISMLKKQKFLKSESYEKLFKDYGNDYGYGISVYNSKGKDVFGHDGRINGYIADYLHFIDEDISIVVLGNVQTGVADFFRRDIASIIFNRIYDSRAKIIPPADAYSEDVEKVLGAYAFGPNFTVYVEMIDGILKAKANEGGYSELVALQDGRYFSRTLYAHIQFVSSDSGLIEKMIWINNDGNTFEGVKK